MQADDKAEYRVFKQHMYGGPKGLGDPNYRHEHSQVNSYTLYDFLIFQRYVENGGRPYDTTGSGMPHILLIRYTFHSLSFSSRECGTLQEHSCVRRRWHSSYLYLNLSFKFMCQQIVILAPPMQPLLSYFQFFLLKVAEFSECSKTNGFSFVMHCRKAKDDMVLFTPSIFAMMIAFVQFSIFPPPSCSFKQNHFCPGCVSKSLDG